MQLEFITQSSRNDADWSANTERLVNMFAEPIPEGGRARFALRSVLGTEEWSQIPGVFIRALHVVFERNEEGQMVERLFATIGGDLWQIEANGAATEIGAVSDCPRTGIAGNNGDVTVVCGGNYYVYDGSTISQPTPGAFDDFGAVEFLSGYTILTERNGRRFQWSALADASDLPGLNFATAEGRDDAIVRPVAINGNLWIFKRQSSEIWALTGRSNENAFARLPGGVRERGLLAHNLIAKAPDSAFFVGDDGVVYVTNGAQFSPVSRTPIETAIEQETPTDCFYYEDEGHKFCVIRFRNRPAWVYDLSTGLWHERATGNKGAWVASSSVYAFGQWRVGRDDGRIGTLVRNNRDVSGALIREATSRTLQNMGGRFRIPALEFMGRVGRSDLGRTASLVVQFSRDGGNTWGTEQVRSMGDLGDYGTRMVFRNLGQMRQITARIRISDPADLRLWSTANAAVV